MDRKQFIIIIVVAVAAIAAGLAVYTYTNQHIIQAQYNISQQIIQAQYNISQAEQCTARVQSLLQRAQDALISGRYTYEQWKDMFNPEVEQLNRECPE
jgi:Flp pilus assembly protein TadB